jgi:RecB family exonuclease
MPDDSKPRPTTGQRSNSPRTSASVPSRTQPRLSASAIERYRRCPKQFWFSNVEGVPSPEEPGPLLAQANAVHHALERLLGLPVEDRNAETAERALRAVWCEHRQRYTFASREEEALYGTEALEMVVRFAETADLSITPLAREQWFSHRLENGVVLYGKLDRLDARPGGIEIVDYKTGRRQLEQEEIPDESAAVVYVLLAERAYQQPVERLRYLYLRNGQSVDWYPEREDVELAAADLFKLIEEIVASEEWLARPGPHCRWCPWQLQCPDRQRVELAELVPVEGLPF